MSDVKYINRERIDPRRAINHNYIKYLVIEGIVPYHCHMSVVNCNTQGSLEKLQGLFRDRKPILKKLTKLRPNDGYFDVNYSNHGRAK